MNLTRELTAKSVNQFVSEGPAETEAEVELVKKSRSKKFKQVKEENMLFIKKSVFQNEFYFLLLNTNEV